MRTPRRESIGGASGRSRQAAFHTCRGRHSRFEGGGRHPGGTDSDEVYAVVIGDADPPDQLGRVVASVRAWLRGE